MRFLADENFPLPSIERLREAGHDVLSASDAVASADDSALLALAVAQGRVVVTFDRDYGELVYRQAAVAPPGLVYLRFRPRTPAEPAEQLLAALASGDVPLEGRLTVVERGHIRQRSLP